VLLFQAVFSVVQTADDLNLVVGLACRANLSQHVSCVQVPNEHSLLCGHHSYQMSSRLAEMIALFPFGTRPVENPRCVAFVFRSSLCCSVTGQPFLHVLRYSHLSATRTTCGRWFGISNSHMYCFPARGMLPSVFGTLGVDFAQPWELGFTLLLRSTALNLCFPLCLGCE
jgi:hypothetical protein